MSQPTDQAAWWPAAVAALLLALAGWWLARVLPSGPRQPLLVAETQPAAEPVSEPIIAPADTLPSSPPTDSLEDTIGVKCPPRPTEFVSSPALRRALVVRRYVGTVGGQTATAVLQWHTPDSTQLRFYLHGGGSKYRADDFRQRPGQITIPIYPDYRIDTLNHGSWTLNGRPGSVLRGFWQKAGRRTSFQFRENYTDAVRYSLRRHLLLSSSDPEIGSCTTLHYEREFLTLLQPSAVAPPLRRLLHATPAAQRRRMLASQDAYSDVYRNIDVQLNGFGLFSYENWYSAHPLGGRRQDDYTSTLIDLRTGRVLTIASQLRPGYELSLRRLLTRHLLHDPDFDDYNQGHNVGWDWNDSTLVDLPDLEEPSADDLTLTPAGLQATYSPVGLLTSWIGPPEIVLIPYRELRPLVRPGTPLARMLAARAMW